MRVTLWSQGDFTSLWEKKIRKERREKEIKEKERNTHTCNMLLVTQRLSTTLQLGTGERMLETQEVYALISEKM